MPDVPPARRFNRQLKRKASEESGVAVGAAAASLGPLAEVLELHAQHRALHRVHAVVEADFIVVIALPLAVIAQAAEAVGDGVVVRDHRAGLAVGPQVLAGIKAKAAA